MLHKWTWVLVIGNIARIFDETTLAPLTRLRLVWFQIFPCALKNFPCALSQISNHTSPQGDVCTKTHLDNVPYPRHYVSFRYWHICETWLFRAWPHYKRKWFDSVENLTLCVVGVNHLNFVVLESFIVHWVVAANQDPARVCEFPCWHFPLGGDGGTD